MPEVHGRLRLWNPPPHVARTQNSVGGLRLCSVNPLWHFPDREGFALAVRVPWEKERGKRPWKYDVGRLQLLVKAPSPIKEETWVASNPPGVCSEPVEVQLRLVNRFPSTVRGRTFRAPCP